MPVPTFRSQPATPRGEGRFNEAVRLHLSGDLDGALRIYGEVLVRHPAHAKAHNNAGAIHAGRGENERAIAHFRGAVKADPRYADAHHSLGLALMRAGAHKDAIEPLQRAVERAGTRASWWIDLANALLEMERAGEALAAYDRAVTLAPGDVIAIANRAVPLRSLGRHAEAIASCQAALAVDPGHVHALSNLGLLLKETRDFDGARRAFDRALAIAPSNATLHVNRAVLLTELNRHEEARAIAERLVETDPAMAAPWNVLGNCALERADWNEARRCNEMALARDPSDRDANWTRAVLTLLGGDLEGGFRRFEARRRLVSVAFVHREFDVPEWDGTPLDGRAILVHAEQGLGDLVQFVRYAATLKSMGAGRVIVECAAAAAPVIRSARGVDEVVTEGGMHPPFDVHAYLLSLPLLCGTTSDSVPANVPYIAPPDRRVAATVRASSAALRVGLAWAGNPRHQRDLIRSVTLDAMAPILGVTGVRFLSLQKGAAASQLAGPRGDGIVNLEPMLDDLGDTAAAIAQLDLVITVDTAVAHLAGALGVPVWVLLPHVPDWRWMLGRDDSPWYPSMRLFRQPAPDAWGPAIESVATALAARAAQHFSGLTPG